MKTSSVYGNWVMWTGVLMLLTKRPRPKVAASISASILTPHIYLPSISGVPKRGKMGELRLVPAKPGMPHTHSARQDPAY